MEDKVVKISLSATRLSANSLVARRRYAGSASAFWPDSLEIDRLIALMLYRSMEKI